MSVYDRAMCTEENDRISELEEALEWIERFTSDRGDAKYADPGQARYLIHRRAYVALHGPSDETQHEEDQC